MKLSALAPPGMAGPPVALRALGIVAFATVLGSTLFTEPRPAFTGDGLIVLLAIVLFAVGLPPALPRYEPFSGARFAGLAAVGVATLLFAIFQPDGAGYAGVYFVVVIGGMGLNRDAAILVCGGTVAGLVAIDLIEGENPAVVAGLLFSVLPWFLIMRLIRRLAGSIEELRYSRAAHAESAALAERGRVARELHDVLAHSLSALALQLEGTRLLARKSDADPEVVEGLERAHRLAVTGLTEARQAISALRGDELPALEDLAGAFPGATFTVAGTPREPSSEARLALYRTAQEALTNVRRHSASDRVELRLVYEDDGTTLTVQDHGTSAPVIGGSGYGLTGMRERAELLGGRLNAGPTDDGFRVELWLPA